MSSDCLRRAPAVQGSPHGAPALSFRPAASPGMVSYTVVLVLASMPHHARRGPATPSHLLASVSLLLRLVPLAQNSQTRVSIPEAPRIPEAHPAGLPS